MQLFSILFFRAVHPDLRGPRRARAAPHADLGERRDRRVRPRAGAVVCRRHVGRGDDDGARHVARRVSSTGRSARCCPSSFRHPSAIRAARSRSTWPASLARSLAPYAATYLAKNYGLQYVGLLPVRRARSCRLAGLLATRETKTTFSEESCQLSAPSAQCGSASDRRSESMAGASRRPMPAARGPLTPPAEARARPGSGARRRRSSRTNPRAARGWRWS